MTTAFPSILLAALLAALPQPEHPFLRNFTATGIVTSAAVNGNFNDEKLYFRNVSASGTLVDVIRDEIDPKYLHGILKDGSAFLYPDNQMMAWLSSVLRRRRPVEEFADGPH